MVNVGKYSMHHLGNTPEKQIGEPESRRIFSGRSCHKPSESMATGVSCLQTFSFHGGLVCFYTVDGSEIRRENHLGWC